ncbi:hypothetical protein V6N11_054308 [Hibiscus sabdariffa]|uniref:Uncharacterized protein n=1 Tax=Hibiscus sabdariffa TaxID=183260 RepID=A0ABR2S3H8_9ROSI
MADAVISAAVGVALSKAISILEDQINLEWDFKDELQKLRSSLALTRAFLHDAETRQLDEPVKVWLEQLRDTAYQADDVLDELSYEDLRRKVEKDNQLARKVSNFFSPSKNPMAFALKMARKVKNINLSIKYINSQATEFGLQQRVQTSSPVASGGDGLGVGGGSHSFGDSSRVVGREADVLKVVDLLIGSTTQQSLSLWILQEMLESVSGRTCDMKNKNAILENIQKELEGKPYLFILDDVWEEDLKNWEDLRGSLLGVNGSTQSCILVTSRSENVAFVRETPLEHRHHLKTVMDEECWSIVKERAYGNSSVSPELEAIGRDVARKCAGVPLVATVIGGTMCNKRDRDEWVSLRDSSLWGSLEKNEGIIKFRMLCCPKIRRIGGGLLAPACLRDVELRACRELTSISLNGGPQSATASTRLETLRIQDSPSMTSIPSLDGLSSLSELTVMVCNRLTSLPSGLSTCTSLRKLFIRSCDSLESIKEDIAGLHSLEELHICRCPSLKKLPEESLGCLTSLKSLDLGPFHEELEEFPGLGSIHHLHSSLKTLRLGKDRFDKLQHLTALKSLHVESFNGLKAIPEWLGRLSSLGSLCFLRCNNLAQLPSKEALRSLLQRTVHMNQTMAFTTIPRPPSLLVPTKNPGRVSSAKGSYNSVRIHGSDPENCFVCSGSRGLSRDGKIILRSLFWNFGSFHRRCLPQNQAEYDGESFSKSRLLIHVAFLCDMAYVIRGKLVVFVHRFMKLQRVYMKKLCQALRTFYKHMVSKPTFKSLCFFLAEALLEFVLCGW